MGDHFLGLLTQPSPSTPQPELRGPSLCSNMEATMVVAFRRPSCGATLPLALLAAAALLGLGTAQPSLQQRTHTFGSYQQIPEVASLLPVFVTTVKVIQGTYAQDDIVSLANGTALDCAPYDPVNGATSCQLVEVWRKQRRAPENQYTQDGATSCEPFAMKYQNEKLRLMVSSQCIAQQVYLDFGDAIPSPTPSRRELAWRNGGRGGKANYAAKAAAKWADKDDNLMNPSTTGLYYDPWEPVRFVVFF